MSEFRTGGAEVASFLERVGDPGAVANRGHVYCKDVAAVTNLFFQDSAGAVFNIGGPAQIDTLNESYNGPGGAGSGRTITADANAVVINGAADANNVLELTTAGGGSGNALNIANDGSGNGVAIVQSGAGDGINVALDSDVAAQGLVVTTAVASSNASGIVFIDAGTLAATAALLINHDAVNAQAALVITREPGGAAAARGIQLVMGANATGAAVDITNPGTGSGLLITQTGAANAIDIDHSAAGIAVDVVIDTSTTNQALVVTEDAVARTTAMVSLARDAAVTSAVAHALAIDNNATLNNALDINQGGGGNAVDILLDGAALTGKGIAITESAVARSTPMVSFVRDAAASGVGIQLDNNGSGNGLGVFQGGAGNAINVVIDGAGFVGQALVVTESAVARTTAMIELTRNAAAVAAGAHVIRIDNDGDGASISISHGGAGDAIAIATNAPDVGAQALVVTETAVARTASLATFIRDAAALGAGIIIDNNGAGNAMQITQGGAADALSISIDGASTAGQGIVVTETAVARTTAMMSLARDAAASGIVLSITNAGSGLSLDVISGNVRIQTGTALGVGAAATLGLIGAAGPTAAAQNEWMRVDTQNGTRFVAVWA